MVGTRKGQSVTVPAPCCIIPNHNDRKVPVWLDRGQWYQDLLEHFHNHNYDVHKTIIKEGEITIRFNNRNHAILFLLTYEQRNQTEEEIF